jgi:hypothetical protein
MFKKLDPSVMKATSDVQGELQISFKYDPKEERLLVKVIKARELNAKDLRGSGSDPFVKVCILFASGVVDFKVFNTVTSIG